MYSSDFKQWLNGLTVIAVVSLLPILGKAQSSTCVVHVDTRFFRWQESKNVFPDAHLLERPSIDIPAINHQNADRVFPTINTYHLVRSNNQNRFIARIRKLTSGLSEIVTINKSNIGPRNPVTCADLNWTLHQFSVMSDAKALILGKESNRSFGEVLIELESINYYVTKRTFPIDEIKTRYTRILTDIRSILERQKITDPLQKMNVIRNVLKTEGLSRYCPGRTSFKDFFEQGCGNCQLQTRLIVSLANDLGIEDSATLKLRIQIFNDHVRPISIQGDRILDLVIAKVKTTTGDPIYSAKYILYLALLTHRPWVDQNLISDIEESTVVRPQNMGPIASAFSSISTQFRSDEWPRDSELRTQTVDVLYFPRSIPSKTKFNPEPIPSGVTTIDLGGDLQRPIDLDALPNIRARANSGGDFFCPAASNTLSDSVARFFSQRELTTLERIRKKQPLTNLEVQNFTHFCNKITLIESIESPIDLYLKSNPPLGSHLSLDEKLRALYEFYYSSIADKIDEMSESLNKDLSPDQFKNYLEIRKVDDYNQIFEALLGNDLFFISRADLDRSFQNFIASHLRFQTSIRHRPLDFLESIKAFRIFDFETIDADIILVRSLYLALGNHFRPNFDLSVEDLGLGGAIRHILLKTPYFLVTQKMNQTQFVKFQSVGQQNSDQTGLQQQETDNIKVPRIHLNDFEIQSVNNACMGGAKFVSLNAFLIPCNAHNNRQDEIQPLGNQILVSWDVMAAALRYTGDGDPDLIALNLAIVAGMDAKSAKSMFVYLVSEAIVRLQTIFYNLGKFLYMGNNTIPTLCRDPDNYINFKCSKSLIETSIAKSMTPSLNRPPWVTTEKLETLLQIARYRYNTELRRSFQSGSQDNFGECSSVDSYRATCGGHPFIIFGDQNSLIVLPETVTTTLMFRNSRPTR